MGAEPRAPGKRKRAKGAGARISRQIGRAIGDFQLLADGDRVLVGLSGGKDSYTLLRMLVERRAFAPIDYEIVAAHVRTNWRCGSCAHGNVLSELCAGLGVAFHQIDTEIRLGKEGVVNCFRCATARRQALFRLAKTLDANKLAFGHHLDDIVETVLMNLFFQGAFAAMLPAQPLFDGALTIIRPLAHVLEADIIRYVDEHAPFERPVCRCPIGKDSQRAQMKQLLKNLEAANPDVRQSIFGALSNVKTDYLPPQAAKKTQGAKR